jgi:hypothetical protein
MGLAMGAPWPGDLAPGFPESHPLNNNKQHSNLVFIARSLLGTPRR